MSNIYKIKVGIEEFEVKEEDIPRIVEAMKNNDIVKLDSGLFRGSAILAVCRDFEKEIERNMLTTPEKSLDEIAEEEKKAKLKEQRLACTICDKKGWRIGTRDGKDCASPCECQSIKEIK